jgi:pectate lyase
MWQYPGRVVDIDWNPDGTQLVYGGISTNGQDAQIVIVPAPSICSATVPDTPALLSAIASANTTICLEAGIYTLDAPITSAMTLVGLGAGAEIIGSLQVSGAGRLTLRNVSVTP